MDTQIFLVALLGVLSLTGLTTSGVANVYASHEDDVPYDLFGSGTSQESDNKIKQVNRNGDNYVIIDQDTDVENKAKFDIDDHSKEQENFYDISDRDRRYSDGGDLKIIVRVESSNADGICLFRANLDPDRWDEEVIRCADIDGPTTVTFRTGVFADGGSFKVCYSHDRDMSDCAYGRNGEENEPEYVTLD